MKSALIVIDVQKSMYDPECSVGGGEAWLNRLAALADRARAAGVPVVYIQHCGPEGHPLEKGTTGWEIHPAVKPASGDLIFEKSEPEAFHDSNIDSELRDRGIGRLIVAGIATEYCVDSAVRGAYRLGYEVVLVDDCHTTWGNEGLTVEQIIDHHNRTLQRFGKVVKSKKVVL